MGFDLASVLQNVSNLNTANDADEMKLISLDLIDPDPNNFYSLDGIDELAANIELVGLQQPLVVRPNGDRFTVISGHRRRAACLMIRDGGNEMFSNGIRCLVDYSTESGAMTELKLIYANSATRVLSGADLQKQTERIEALLYQLKNEGIEFPGRMRDHVAEVCRISASKIARLNAIKKNLIKDLYKKYEQGDINESVAYTLSTMHPDIQQNVMEFIDSRSLLWKSRTEGYINSLGKAAAKMTTMQCEKKPDELCGNASAMLSQCFGYGYESSFPCANVKCCRNCAQLRSCSHACEKCKPEIDAAEKQRAEEREAEAARVRAEHDATAEYVREVYQHTSELIDAAGLSADEYFEAVVPQKYGPKAYLKSYTDNLDNPEKLGYSSGLPFGAYVSPESVKTIIKAADTLGVSTDDILLHEAPEKNVFNLNTEPQWMTGDPPKNGRYWCLINIEGSRIENKLEYRFGNWYFSTGHMLDSAAVVEKIFPLPEAVK